MTGIKTTVLPFTKGTAYTLDQLREHARAFYGPRAYVPANAREHRDAPIIGVLEVGDDSWAVIELPEGHPDAAA